VKENIVN